jgi:hypothetical protein
MNLRLICINNESEEAYLTVGKEYIAIFYTPNMSRNNGGVYFIYDHLLGSGLTVEADKFITLEDWREQQIKSIIDEI